MGSNKEQGIALYQVDVYTISPPIWPLCNKECKIYTGREKKKKKKS